MKEIMIAYIMIAFVILFMIGTALFTVMHRTNTIARIAIGQDDFDDYVFIAPDGFRYTAWEWGLG